jgi:hypothetical protein
VLLGAYADNVSETRKAIQLATEMDDSPEVAFAVLSEVERWREWMPTARG